MMIDTHCHLTSNKYSEPINEIITSAKKEGVEKFITIGTSLESNLENQKVAEQYKEVYFSAGIYPHEHLDLSVNEIETKFKKQLKNMPGVVGIGECGIDITNRSGQRNLDEQIKLFKMQAEIAEKMNLPLVIHNRNGDEQIYNIISKFKNLKGVAHTFTSSWEFAQKLLDSGFYISFSGIITYPSGKDILETVEKVPLDKFLVETDSPYLSPQPHRSQINRPEYVKITAQKIAEIKNLPLREIEDFSYNNACDLFDLPQN